ncbi:hypothetical protein PIB30_079916 [Stylosanthes scabra]|uniref:Uncharacterized protein n=1 Tax=Stylosanthes scabra TaxID=79078 RepID=A0ABU6QSI4_9FABA|nr:hypothetical protein [Stylosanthes scabra]
MHVTIKRSFKGCNGAKVKLEFFLDTFRKHERSSGWLRFLAVEPAVVEVEPLVGVFASHPESANKTE